MNTVVEDKAYPLDLKANAAILKDEITESILKFSKRVGAIPSIGISIQHEYFTVGSCTSKSQITKVDVTVNVDL